MTMMMNTMNLTNITAFSKGQQVQEPPCQYSPLRVFQGLFAAPQVEDDDKEADDDDCKVDDDDNKFLFFVSKLLTSIAVKKRLINKQRTYTGASKEAIISTPALLMVTDIGTPISLLRFITTLIIIKINMFV